MSKAKEAKKQRQQLGAALTEEEHTQAKIQALKEGKTFTQWLSDIIRRAIGATN